jgi:hypothetical protein
LWVVLGADELEERPQSRASRDDLLCCRRPRGERVDRRLERTRGSPRGPLDLRAVEGGDRGRPARVGGLSRADDHRVRAVRLAGIREHQRVLGQHLRAVEPERT